MENYRIPAGTGIGHVHLKVADIDRAIAFYNGVLGFDQVMRLGDQAAFLSAGGYHHHIGLNTWHSLRGSPAPRHHTGLYHFAIRYPTRADLARAVQRVIDAGAPLQGVADHGVSESIYLRQAARSLGRPVRLSNDANCFALSEATDGAGRGVDVVFGVIIGTGTGGGIVVKGKVLEGRNRIAGEWGHSPLPWSRDDERPGPPCYCGRMGCIETFISGPGLSASYAALSQEPVDASEIAGRAEAGERIAERALEVYEGRVARALASIINVLDPGIIVLGGGLSNIARLYTNVPVLWQPFVFSDSADTPLVRARYGDSSGVRGAAWLWRDTDEEST